MDVFAFREYVLSLGEVEEKMPFGKFARRYDNTLVFYTRGHMFCLCDVADFDEIDVRSTAEELPELLARYPSVTRPVNPAMKLWVGLPLDGSIPADVIRTYVRRAYEIIRDKYTPRPK